MVLVKFKKTFQQLIALGELIVYSASPDPLPGGEGA